MTSRFRNSGSSIACGRRISGFNQGAVQKLIKGRGMSLPRSALASALYEAVKDRVDVRFGNSVTSLEDSPRGVEVTFREGEPQTFDLVIGADGLHSAVRRLCFGEETRFERFLGYYVAAFTAQGYRFRDPDAYVTYGEPGRQIWRITVDEDTTVFMLVFAESDPHAAPVHDASRQKEVLTRLYSGGGWETDEMLHALQASTDLYFDRVSQIVMPSWTKGRVALIGDACACPSLLAGEGSAMAMAEAYTLAGELVVAQGDHASAFEMYEQRLRPYVERKQKGARDFAASFVPRSAYGLWLRNAIHQRREPPWAHSAAVQSPNAQRHRTAELSVTIVAYMHELMPDVLAGRIERASCSIASRSLTVSPMATLRRR